MIEEFVIGEPEIDEPVEPVIESDYERAKAIQDALEQAKAAMITARTFLHIANDTADGEVDQSDIEDLLAASQPLGIVVARLERLWWDIAQARKADHDSATG